METDREYSLTDGELIYDMLVNEIVMKKDDKKKYVILEKTKIRFHTDNCYQPHSLCITFSILKPKNKNEIVITTFKSSENGMGGLYKYFSSEIFSKKLIVKILGEWDFSISNTLEFWYYENNNYYNQDTEDLRFGYTTVDHLREMTEQNLIKLDKYDEWNKSKMGNNVVLK